MAKYYFDVRNGHRLIDPSGLDCESDKDAMTKAKVIAKQIAGDIPNPSTPRKIAVMDSDRQEIDHVDISDDNEAEHGGQQAGRTHGDEEARQEQQGGRNVQRRQG